MAIKTLTDFLGGYASHSTIDAASRDCQNYYPEILSGSGSKSQIMMRQRPGTKVWSPIGSVGYCRGMYPASDGSLYVVYGSQLYYVAPDKTLDSIVSVGVGTSDISFADNGYNIVIVDGLSAWSINLSTRETEEINLVGFNKPKQVVWFGNRFIIINNDVTTDQDIEPTINTRNNNKFYFSSPGVEASSTWAALDFEVAGMDSAPIERMEISGGELYLYSKIDKEVWRYTADSTAPFERANGTSSGIGIGANKSLVNIGGMQIFLGSGSVGGISIWSCGGNGYTPVKISDVYIDSAIQSIVNSGVDVSDAIGQSYSHNGHIFYVISFINGDKSFSYDLTTQMWHRLSTRDYSLDVDHKWEFTRSAYAYGKQFFADSSNPYLLEINDTYYSDYVGTAGKERPIRRIIRGPVLFSALSPFIIREFVLDCETGIAPQNGQGSNPKIMLRVSKNGGRTPWSPERWIDAGKVGDYSNVVRCRNLGMSREFVVEITISDPFKLNIFGARVDTEQTLKR